MISVSTSQTFCSWVVIFLLHRPMEFLSLSLYIRYTRACSSYECFILRARRPSSKLLKQGYLVKRLKSQFRKFHGRYGDLIQQYEVSLSRLLNYILTLDKLQWLPNRSYFPPIFMTLIPGLTFTELRVVVMEHLQGAWLASRERFPFRTPGSVPPFGDLLLLQLLWPVLPYLPYLFLNYSRYLLDFALTYWADDLGTWLGNFVWW